MADIAYRMADMDGAVVLTGKPEHLTHPHWCSCMVSRPRATCSAS